MRNLYGVFVGTKFGMSTNKREALKAAKLHEGYVTRMSYPRDTHAWDGPTFRACSDLIADYRPTRIKRARLADRIDGRHWSVCHFDEDSTLVDHLQHCLNGEVNGTCVRPLSGHAPFTHILFCGDGGGHYAVEFAGTVE